MKTNIRNIIDHLWKVIEELVSNKVLLLFLMISIGIGVFAAQTVTVLAHEEGGISSSKYMDKEDTINDWEVIDGSDNRQIEPSSSDDNNNISLAEQLTQVDVVNRYLLVNGGTFTIRGIGYSPVPIGVDPTTTPPYGDYYTKDHKDIYARDLPNIRSLGANTIRLWGWNNEADHTEFLDMAYNDGVNPIYVIPTFWMGSDLDISDPATRYEIKTNFKNMVSSHKHHPAVLMWAIGNELNGPWNYGDNLDDLFSLINEMAEQAHLEEGAGFHPVTSPLVDIDLINTIDTYNANVPNIDVWSANVYRGHSFGSLFIEYAVVGTKPLAILEFGIDAYDNNRHDEYQNTGTPSQAIYAQSLWQDMMANSDVCSGGCLMNYSDEWWKGKYGQISATCPDHDPAVHSICGYRTDAHPDSYANEEWWGVMRTVDNGSDPDIMVPRDVYIRMQALWWSPLRYDTNHNEKIDYIEMVDALMDYLLGDIEYSYMVDVLMYYLTG